MFLDRWAFVVAVRIIGLLKRSSDGTPSEKLILGIEKTYAWIINKSFEMPSSELTCMVLRRNNGGATVSAPTGGYLARHPGARPRFSIA